VIQKPIAWQIPVTLVLLTRMVLICKFLVELITMVVERFACVYRDDSAVWGAVTPNDLTVRFTLLADMHSPQIAEDECERVKRGPWQDPSRHRSCLRVGRPV
jgi:hypothetical protein